MRVSRSARNDVLRRFAAGWHARQEVGVTPERRGPFVPPPGYGLMPRTIGCATLRTLASEGWLRMRTDGAVSTWTATDTCREYVAELDAKRTRPPATNRRGGWKAGGHSDHDALGWEHP